MAGSDGSVSRWLPKTLRARFLAALSFLGTSLAPLHPDCVTVRVVACGSFHTITTTVTLSSVDLCADVRVTPHPDHRWVALTWDYAREQPESLQASQPEGERAGLGSVLSPGDSIAPEGGYTGAAGYSRASLDGERAAVRPKPQGWKMEMLSGGTYEVVATVYSDVSRRQQHGRAVTRVTIR